MKELLARVSLLIIMLLLKGENQCENRDKVLRKIKNRAENA